jgi:hypothetical protein
VHRGYLIVLPRPMPAAPLVAFRMYLIKVPRSLPRPRRCRSRRKTTLADVQMKRANFTRVQR